MRIFLISAVGFLTTVAGAQAKTSPEGWRLSQLTLYGSVTGITGITGAGARKFPDGETVVDIDAAGVLDVLDFSLFGAADAFTERVIGQLGNRSMRIDRDSDDLKPDVDMIGPPVGLIWTL